MSSFPCLVRFVSGSGQVRYRPGERLVDRYLEFVAGRCRPNPRLPSYGPAESRCRSGPAAGASWDRGVAMPYKPGPVAPGPAGQLRQADGR